MSGKATTKRKAPGKAGAPTEEKTIPLPPLSDETPRKMTPREDTAPDSTAAKISFVSSSSQSSVVDDVERETTGGPRGAVFIFDDGAKYEGEWTTDASGGSKRHGEGVWTDGEQSYEGEWCEDAMQGTGTYHFASGAVYEGSFEANAFHGEGVYTWPDGSSYTGQWCQGKMNGEGTYTDVAGVQWKGRFYNGKGPGLVAVNWSPPCAAAHS